MESKPQRALSSYRATAGLVAITPQEELALVTTTVTMQRVQAQQRPSSCPPPPPLVLATLSHTPPAGLSAGTDKKVIARKVLGTVRWFSVRNRYDFINRSDTKEDIFVQQTATQNNPRKYLYSEGDETVEFDVVQRGTVWRQQML